MTTRVVLIVLVLIIVAPTPLASRDTCDIEAIYEMDTDVPDLMVLTKEGEIVDLSEIVEAVLTPAQLKAGSYEISVTRRSQNLYEVDGNDLVIVTRYCHQHARRAEAVLEYRGPYGYSKGTLAFKD